MNMQISPRTPVFIKLNKKKKKQTRHVRQRNRWWGGLLRGGRGRLRDFWRRKKAEDEWEHRLYTTRKMVTPGAILIFILNWGPAGIWGLEDGSTHIQGGFILQGRPRFVSNNRCQEGHCGGGDSCEMGWSSQQCTRHILVSHSTHPGKNAAVLHPCE